jgi:hypothetical protein
MAPDSRLLYSLDAKRLIFTVTTGRSGTGYLSRLLSYLRGVRSEHEPEPRFQVALRRVQRDPKYAQEFWLRHKLPVIAATREPVYAETSHVLCKGFLEALLDLGITPSLIALRRDFRAVALSHLRIGAIPGRTHTEFHLSPDDPGVLALPHWELRTDYELCYWQCLEIERRSEIYCDLVRSRGGAVSELTLDELRTWAGFRGLRRDLALSRFSGVGAARYVMHSRDVDNAKTKYKRHLGAQVPDVLDALERQVLDAVAGAPRGER